MGTENPEWILISSFLIMALQPLLGKSHVIHFYAALVDPLKVQYLHIVIHHRHRHRHHPPLWILLHFTSLHSRTIDAEQIVIKSLSRVNKGHQVVKLVHKFEGNWQTLVDNLSSATLSKLQEVECSPRGSLPALSFIADNPQVMENLCFCNGIRIAIQYDLSVSSDKVSQFMVILWRVPCHASFTSS